MGRIKVGLVAAGLAIALALLAVSSPIAAQESAADLEDATAPTVTSVAITSDAGEDATYGEYDYIYVAVTFSEDVVYSGRVSIDLEVGDDVRSIFAYESEGSVVNFRHQLRGVGNDSDGVSVLANTLTLRQAIHDFPAGVDLPAGVLEAGVLEDLAGNAADLAHPGLDDDPNHRVDGPPVMQSITEFSDPGEDGIYGLGEHLELALTFNEDVVLVDEGQTPHIWAGINGGSAIQVTANRAEGDQVIFRYTIPADTRNINTLSFERGLVTHHYSIQDTFGNKMYGYMDEEPPSISVTIQVLPRLTAMWLHARPEHHPVYLPGETIYIVVTFNKPVRSQRNQLALEFDSGTRMADIYQPNSSLRTQFDFTYTVTEDDYDSDGIVFPADPITGAFRDASWTAADLTRARERKGREIFGPKAYQIEFMGFVSDPGEDRTYKIGDTVEFQVALDIDINGAVEAKLPEYIGNLDWFTDYDRTETAINFTRRIEEGDLSVEGIDVAGLGPDPDHRVDGVRPAVMSVAITSDPGEDDTYGVGDTITFSVTFDKEVAVTGTPYLRFDMDDRYGVSFYTGGDGTTADFAYTVSGGDMDDDGISIGANSVGFNGGTIKDSVGNDADLSHEAVEADSGHMIFAPGGL